MAPVAITPQRLETLARVLRLAGERALLDPDRHAGIHAAFIAADSQGAWWTVGLESGRWNRRDGDTWVAGDPPRELFVESEVRTTLEGLEARLASPAPGETAAPAASESTGRASPYAPPGYVPPAGSEPRPVAAAATDSRSSGPSAPASSAGAGPARTSAHPRDERMEPAAPRPASPARTRARQEDDWSHVTLCVALAAFFVALGYWKTDPRAFAASGLFGLLVVILTGMNLAQSRR